MLNGKGSQYWLTNEYEDKRKKALEDRTKFSDETLDELDVLDDITLGGGKTDSDTYIIQQFPYPLDSSIRGKKNIDIRDADKRVGGS